MESIDKLRRALNSCMHTEKTEKPFDTYWITASACDTLIDEIEREVADRYIALPLDMDGIPIREGDTVQFVNDAGGTGAAVEVCAVSEHYAYYYEGKHFYRAANCRHVAPRTLEDVLRSVVTLCANTWKDDKSAFRHYDVDDVMESGNIAGFAAEIRELTEVD